MLAPDMLGGQQCPPPEEPVEAGEVRRAITMEYAQVLQRDQVDQKEVEQDSLSLAAIPLSVEYQEKPKRSNEVTLGMKAARSNEEMIKIYQDNIQRFGFQPRTLLYPNDELHEAKVDQHCFILSELIRAGEIGRNDSLLDVGCGYGSLAEKLEKLLEETGHAGVDIRYKGIDIVPEFIKHAKEICNERGFLFQEMDLERYEEEEDWCILLGVVNSVPEPEKLVHLALSKCKKGLLVDFNDREKIPYTSFHKFDIDEQIESLYRAGAKEVERYLDLANCPWTILLVRK